MGFCLDGLNHPKAKPFEYILMISKPSAKPEKTIEHLKQEAVILQKNATPIDVTIPVFDFSESRYEKDPIFKKNIVGNEYSSVSSLIKQLDNQNWVREGLKYLESVQWDRRHCPFCQQETITNDFIKKINDFFSGEYEKDMQCINHIVHEYETAVQFIYKIPTVFFEEIPFLNDLKQDFQRARDGLCDILEKNIDRMREKRRTPNIEIMLENSEDALKKVNDVLSIARHRVEDFNRKILQKQQSLNELKKVFWQIQRWEYDQTISLYTSSKQAIDKDINNINSNIKIIDNRIVELMHLISEEQQKTVNIKDAVDHINSNLLAIGIDAFQVDQFQDNLYKITRNGQSGSVFPSLSEGEKMIISFLYFLELCRGKQSGAEVITKKIIVIDDPISSLSHIYVFNVSKLIEDEFFKNSSNYEQVFILTHSLYFFHELHKLAPRPNLLKGDSDEIKEKNHIETINRAPNLFRFSKNSTSSYISVMHPSEIQNDYQAYWSIVKDSNSSHALIANAMRNIIEYFFGFINKSDFNNVFQKPTLRDNKFQAFNRFMNAESHSRPHLVCDYKEFDYAIFIEAFRLVFVESGYQEHYDKMMGIK